jgi:hypothetical protein
MFQPQRQGLGSSRRACMLTFFTPEKGEVDVRLLCDLRHGGGWFAQSFHDGPRTTEKANIILNYRAAVHWGAGKFLAKRGEGIGSSERA